MSPRRMLTAVTVALCFAASPAMAGQYRVFNHNGVAYTDVVINNMPQTLASIQDFEAKCQTPAIGGNWWMNAAGEIGPVGSGATFNIRTCRPVTRRAAPDNFRVYNQTARNGSCTFFGSGGSICRTR